MLKQERTFLKVFIEHEEKDDFKANDISSSPAASYGSSGSGLSSSYQANSIMSTQTAEYTIVPIISTSTASDVCQSVARKRNLLYTTDEQQYELIMCDGDGQGSYETTLEAFAKPWQFQQSAAKHGHLGDFHFVFRKAVDEGSDEGGDSSKDSDDEQPMFGQMPRQNMQSKHNYPSAWMEKRGKKHKAWRRRYFVLIGDELLYYKRKDVFEHNKEPIARIELTNPPAIVKILQPETSSSRTSSSSRTLFCFNIHTPKRIYSLRIDNYNDMIYWVRALNRRNEANELLDGLDSLIAESESLHANDDEQMMDKFSNLESILADTIATDSFLKYLQTQHNAEFIHFWLDLKQYLNNYNNSSKDKQKRFAMEIFDKYIQNNAKQQLSEIRSKSRSALRIAIETGLITRNMFADIRQQVFDYLNRDSYKFFNSSEYYRFIITYKCIDTSYQDKFSWIQSFEQNIEETNKKRYKIMMSSNQSTLYAHHQTPSRNANNYFKRSVHSPVLQTNFRPNSPVTNHSHNKNKMISSKSWTGNGNSAFLSSSNDSSSPFKSSNGYLNASNANNNKTRNKKHRSVYGISAFVDAPGLNNNKKSNGMK